MGNLKNRAKKPSPRRKRVVIMEKSRETIVSTPDNVMNDHNEELRPSLEEVPARVPAK